MTTTNETTTNGTRRRRAAAVLVSSATALVTWYLLTSALGVDLVAVGRGAVTWPAVLTAGLLVGLAGWLVLAALEHTGRHARRRWTLIALGVLLLSLPAPIAQGATWAAGAGLATLHLALAAVLVPLLAGTARR